jgi:2-oxoglutarate ferredoxin oxidoreductase subunit gamma
MVALGVIGKVLEQWGLLHPESVKKALLARVPKGTEELNEKAFEAGYALL